MYWSGDPNRGFGKDQPGSWVYNVLPFIEQQALRQLGYGTDPSSTQFQQASRQLHTTPLEGLHCPSRRPSALYPATFPGIAKEFKFLLDVGQDPGVVKTDYAANSGDSYHSAAASSLKGYYYWQPNSYTESTPTATRKVFWVDAACDAENLHTFQSGVSHYRSEITLQRIQDGTANTYMIGEKWLASDRYESSRIESATTPGFSYGENQSAYSGWEWDQHRVAWNELAGSDAEDIEAFQPAQDRSSLRANHPEVRFGSAHPDSFNMAFCDGSVHSISYDIDYQTHAHLANRVDGATTAR
jgi:prepilin-type processing-associated H-X9-DG protein